MKKQARLFAFNLVLLSLGLVALELVFGSWISPGQRAPLNLLRDVTYRFNVSHLYAGAGQGSLYRRDRYGLRGLEGNPSEIDLLTVGGSTTDQRYLSEGQTWQDVLENDWIRSGHKMEVVNAGLDGLSTVGEIRSLEFWFPRIPSFYARYILLYNGINDLFSERTGPYDDVDGTKSFKGIIRSKSALYQLYQRLYRTYLGHLKYPVRHQAIDFSHKKWTTDPLQSSYEALMKRKLESYGGNLVILDKKIRAFGAESVFVTQPSRMFRRENDRVLGVTDTLIFEGKPINGVDFYHMLTLINEATMASCKQLKGICIDLAQDLSFEEGDFYDYFHTTPSGAEKIGHYLFEKLKNAV